MYRFLVTMKLKPGALATVVAASRPLVEATRKEPGNIAYDFYAHAGGKDTVVVVEAFKDRAAHKHHDSLPHVTGFFEIARPLIVEGKLEVIVDDEA